MEEEFENGAQESIKPPKGLKGIGHKIRNGFKNFFKKSANVGRMNFKNIFVQVIVKKFIAFVVPLLIVLACFWYVISDEPARAALTSNTTFFSNPSNVSSEEVAEYYKQNASLLLATKEDIKNASDAYLKDIESRSASMFKILSLEDTIGAHEKNTISSYGDLEYGNLYEYILNTEKINFNKINWKKIVRGQDKGKVDLVKDDKTNLKYPSNDDDNKEMIDFANMVRPYLQTWIIPLSMLSGTLTETSSNRNANFVYEIVENAAHNIEIEQHTLGNITRYKTTDNYRTDTFSINIYKKTFTYTYTKADGSTGTGSYTLHAYVKGDVVTGVSEDIELVTEEIAIDSEYASKDKTKGQKIEYVFSKAEMYDNIQQSKYSVELYNETDVENKEKYDTIMQVKSVDYLTITGLSGYTEISAVGDWTYEKTVNYTARDGTYITDEMVWNDHLKTDESVTRDYTTADVANYVETAAIDYTAPNSGVNMERASILDATAEDYETKKKEKEESDILTKEEKDYYNVIQDDEKKTINRIDLINSIDLYRPEKEKFRDVSNNHIGYTRKALSTSYDILERYLTQMAEENNLRLMYGVSIVGDILQQYDYGTYYGFIWPVPIHVQNGLSMAKQITCDYVSWRELDGRAHWAIDIGHHGQTNIDIVASKSGEVITSKYNAGGYGNYVIIKHNDGYFSLYAHMADGSVKVNVGDQVSQGQVIGTMGTTGFSTGVHLHWEIKKGENNFWNAEPVDPKSFFNEDCSPKGNAVGHDIINQIVTKAKQMAEAKKILYRQSSRQIYNNIDKLDSITQTDCSGFISSLYSAYMGIKIETNTDNIKIQAEKGTIGNGWSAVVGEYSGNITVLQPGDILYRKGHVGMYVGDGMQVDHGGPGGANSESNPSWKGPSLRTVDSDYTHYIRYTNSGLSTGVENFDARTKPTTNAAIDATLDQLSDREILARIIYGEQGGQSFESQVLVGISVLNRVDRNNSSIKEIAKSKYKGSNGKQYYHYNCVGDNGFWKKIPSYCVSAADKAIEAKKQGSYNVLDVKTNTSVNAIDVYGFYATKNMDGVKDKWNNWNLRAALYNENASNKYTAFYYVPW